MKKITYFAIILLSLFIPACPYDYELRSPIDALTTLAALLWSAAGIMVMIIALTPGKNTPAAQPAETETEASKSVRTDTL